MVYCCVNIKLVNLYIFLFQTAVISINTRVIKTVEEPNQEEDSIHNTGRVTWVRTNVAIRRLVYIYLYIGVGVERKISIRLESTRYYRIA
jgi:hypothetical protein